MMMNEMKKWDSFFIGGKDGVFELCSTSSGIDKNKLLENNIKKIPYITRTNKNNGLSLFVGEKQLENNSIDQANVITIGLDTQTVFYQPYKFYTGQNIQVLTNDYINKYNALYISQLLKIQLKKLNWGGNGATLSRLERTKIMLPVNDEGNPDYEYMETYIKSIEKAKTDLYMKYNKARIADLGKNIIIPDLSQKKWKEFPMNTIFSIMPGVRLESYNMTDGKTAFIGATDSNNGITNFVSNKNKSLDNNVLGLNYNGSVGECFYHRYNCIFSDDVKRLHLLNHDDNEYVLLFFKTIILKQKDKYRYGYKFNGNRMARQLINVPVNDNDEPDYAYMEQYIKNLMIKQYSAYGDFVKV